MPAFGPAFAGVTDLLPARSMNLISSPALRILHVVDSLEFGGLERVVTDLAIAQRQAGHHVEIFSINATKGFAPELEAAGIKVMIGNKQGTLDRQVIKTLRRACLHPRVDVVHAHNFMPGYYVATALTLAVNAPAFVGSCHDMGTRLKERKLRWLFRFALSRMAGVAMVGKQVHDRYVLGGMVSPHKATTVLNGIPVAKFAQSAERRAEARRRLSLAADDLVVGCVGRLVALKNHRVLLDTVPALAARHPKLQVVIVGYGEEEDRLRAQTRQLGIEDRVIITGQRSDVADLLPGFDMFTLPSQTEGVSIALLEACATGLAVVATRVGGNPEIIRDGTTGLLVEPSNTNELQTALDTLLSQADRRQLLGGNARLWVSQHASTESLCREYDQFYRRAIDPKSHRTK